MTSPKGKRVLITGGAGGIGFCTAEEFAKAGSDLILTDIDKKGLEKAAKKLRRHGQAVHTSVVDVTVRSEVEAMAEWANSELGGIDILINNAGVGCFTDLESTSLDKWKQLIDINLWGPLYHIYAFLPSFIERGSGHIVNVSSGQAFFKLPGWGAYAAIKAALGITSEVLHFEMRKHNIEVTTVYPFMVNTPFYQNIKGDTWGARLAMKLVPYYSSTPENVGRIIFKSVKRNAHVETVSILNDVAFYAQVVPFASDVIGRVTEMFVGKSSSGKLKLEEVQDGVVQ